MSGFDTRALQLYHKGIADDLLDGYEDMGALKDKGMSEGLTQEDFESGSIIGSPFFKFQFFRNRKIG